MKQSHILAALACLGALALLPSAARAEESGPLTVITTIYPEYDWILNILGENPSGVQVRYLQDTGADLHSFNPSVENMADIASCDLFVYVGGISDSWAEDALASPSYQPGESLRLLDVLGDAVLAEELAEGMQAGEEEHEEEEEPDEHIWLSLKNARLCTEALKEALIALDPGQAELYEKNAGAYEEQLAVLDERYRETIEAAPGDTLLFGDRFPFLYLTRDYGLSYYAAFPGCSAETGASFETIIFLAGKVDELSLPCVLTLEGSDARIAETIARSTKKGDCKILTLDSLQSVPRGAEPGYLAVMEKNLEVLQEALS